MIAEVTKDYRSIEQRADGTYYELWCFMKDDLVRLAGPSKPVLRRLNAWCMV